MYKVVEDNDRIRILEGRGKPGTDIPLHSHPPCAVVFLNDCKLTTSSPDGKTETIDAHAGMVGFNAEAFEHSGKVLGDNEAHFFVIELKK